MTRAKIVQRLTKEIRDVATDAAALVSVLPIDESDLSKLRGEILGPADTPYAGGQFVVKIDIPDDYPFRPPSINFITRIWHPNISSQTGAICLDVLKNAWSPIMNVKAALISLQSLLSNPEPTDPQDAQVANMMLQNMPLFELTAHDWAIRYANAPRQDINIARWKSSLNGKFEAGSPIPKTCVTTSRGDNQANNETKLQYRGYNKNLVERFVSMGVEVSKVINAFESVGLATMAGEDFELGEERIDEIITHIFSQTNE